MLLSEEIIFSFDNSTLPSASITSSASSPLALVIQGFIMISAVYTHAVTTGARDINLLRHDDPVFLLVVHVSHKLLHFNTNFYIIDSKCTCYRN